MEKLTGTVKWFDSKKGYGFITADNGQDVFVHYTGIAGNGFRTLEEGERVSFNVTESDKGLKAVDVERL
jgi:CspA family cold shock protein